MIESLQSIVDWTAAHSAIAGILVFIIAMAESLVVVGLVVPGAAMMIVAGALVALGALAFWPTVLLAVVGAIVGDGVSFWMGHRYRGALRGVWPFRRHPDWLVRGEDFFHRHGGKSVFLGRFVGPVRPIVPAVAGMLDMRPAAFYAVNVLSALAWAPAYLLPGMAFGASLALAGEVAARLAVLLVLLGAMTWFILWMVRWLFRVLPSRGASVAKRFLSWASRHPRASRLIGGLLDPARSESKALLAMGALLIASAWLFLGVLEDVVTADPLVRVDAGVYQLLQGLRTPWGDRIMVFATEFGDGVVLVLVTLSVLAWLLWRRSWRAAMYWAAAAGFGQLAATVLKLVLQRPRPPGAQEALSTFAFPSGHATMSMVVYGFLAVLVARDVSRPRRWLAFALAMLLVGAIALSRLYLGAHWLSDVLGGLSLGLAWVCVLGISYYRHPASVPTPRGLTYVALVALLLAAGSHVAFRYATDLARYTPRVIVRHLDADRWWREDWPSLPDYREDLEGELEQPLNVQFAGTLASLRAQLGAQGWHDPIPLSATSALRWLLPAPALAELPVLPQVHDGRHESLLMTRAVREDWAQQGERATDGQLVLRLWSTGVVIDPNALPLWVGSVSRQEPRRVLLLTLPATAPDYDASFAALMQSMSGVERRVVRRSLGAGDIASRWNGNVLLLREK